MVIVCSQYDAEDLAKYLNSSGKAGKTAIIVWAKFADERDLIGIWQDMIQAIVLSMTSQPTTTIMIEEMVKE